MLLANAPEVRYGRLAILVCTQRRRTPIGNFLAERREALLSIVPMVVSSAQATRAAKPDQILVGGFRTVLVFAFGEWL